MIINDKEYLLACLRDIEEQDLLDSLLPTDEVMQKTKNRVVNGSDNSLYNYFEGALDKHHGGMSYDEEKWICLLLFEISVDLTNQRRKLHIQTHKGDKK